MNILTLDVETPIKNKGHVFTPENFLVSYSIKRNNEPVSFHYYTEPDFLSALRNAMAWASLVVGFSSKFDLHWVNRVLGNIGGTYAIYDCSLAEFILTGQEAAYASLDETLASYGLEAKDDKVKEYWERGISTEHIPVDVLEEYNNRDVDLTYQLYLAQLQVLSEKQRNLVMLEGEDMKTLIEAETNGMKWDKDGAKAALRHYRAEVGLIGGKLWKYVPEEAKKYFNWESGDDVSCLLYGGLIEYDYCTETPAVYKSGEREGQEYIKRSWYTCHVEFPQHFKPLDKTLVKKCQKPGYKGTLYYQVDEPTLKQLKGRRRELVELLLSRAKVQKIVEMIEELFKVSEEYGWEDNLLHGQFNQNVVRTGRLSSSKPNMQNKPPELDMFLVSRYA